MPARSAIVSAARGVRDVPRPVQCLGSVSRIDDVDHFVLETEVDASPERWARALFGDTPDLAERFIWRGLLGLRLAAGRSPATVAGWRIAARGDDWIRLEAHSPYLTGNLVIRASRGQEPRREVSLTTFVHYVRCPAGVVWPPLSILHRRLVPGLLQDAEHKVVARTRARPAAHPDRPD